MEYAALAEANEGQEAGAEFGGGSSGEEEEGAVRKPLPLSAFHSVSADFHPPLARPLAPAATRSREGAGPIGKLRP